MRTPAKRSLVKQAKLEQDLALLLALIELDLVRAGRELDRWYSELERDVERELERGVDEAPR